ncbi:SDR family NAD(P)-dependent oxidoreductase [Flavisphingomonas formosensis]|uniref:SDR family NAD(P)-dependent oxidoreductase n=1 Tax=Flavisphingomonas formosensis TaxID=861534 RepID=UPI0012F884B9|nr:SDR family NAD(P)-dependent oxidoreductase [Sphingomonas formosensis]
MPTQTGAPAVEPGFPEAVTAETIAAGYDLSGKRAVVTGAASGLGRETARVLAARGAEVVLAVRDVAAGEKVAVRIREAGGKATVEQLDLGDATSVRAFADRVGRAPVHLLIANAGIMACPEGRTADGHEMQFGTNHVGHFALTLLLLPALEQAAPSRVVVLSSGGHALGDIDLDDVNFERRGYDPFLAYGQSKTANILFASELDRRYADRGIRAFSVNPGAVATSLGRHMSPTVIADQGWDKIGEIRMQTPGEGAATQVWAAIGRELEGKGGLYLEECHEAPVAETDQPLHGVQPRALDPDRARRLWEWSEKATGVRG